MDFASDNWVGAVPEILDALKVANDGVVPSYGADELSKKVERKFQEVFETDCAVYFVATGGAANGLALSVLTPPYGMIFCHEQSHVQMDECAGPEFYTGGAKLLPVHGAAGKISAAVLKEKIAEFPIRPPHGAPPSVLSLTQGTECGTLYSIAETKALCDVAHDNGMSVHMDGARFANAVAATGSSPAALSWKAGVDVLCFGGTKNGCVAAEAVIFFHRELAKDFEFRRKRAGHLLSKMRFIAAQFGAYLQDDLWLSLARHANEQAQRLSKGLAALEGVEVAYPTEINEVFPVLPSKVVAELHAKGARFYPWVTPGDPANGQMHRLIASFATRDEDVDAFIEAIKIAISSEGQIALRRIYPSNHPAVSRAVIVSKRAIVSGVLLRQGMSVNFSPPASMKASRPAMSSSSSDSMQSDIKLGAMIARRFTPAFAKSTMVWSAAGSSHFSLPNFD